MLLRRLLLFVISTTGSAAPVYNPILSDWEALQTYAEVQGGEHDDAFAWGLSESNLTESGSTDLTDALTIAHALRVALGDEAYRTRKKTVVVHLVGFASFREDQGVSHDDYVRVRASVCTCARTYVCECALCARVCQYVCVPK